MTDFPQEINVKQIAKEMGCHHTTAGRRMNELEAMGLVSPLGYGRGKRYLRSQVIEALYKAHGEEPPAEEE